MTAILIAGYKNTELGIFKESDQRIKIIKKIIRRDLKTFIEEGVDWLVFAGNLGFEFWVLEVAKELQDEYPLSLATIFNFENHGTTWNEMNQQKLEQFKSVDYVKYAYESYSNPSQFRQYNTFLINSTQGAYVFYDSEFETSLKFLYQQMNQQSDYNIKTLTMDALNDFVIDFEE